MTGKEKVNLSDDGQKIMNLLQEEPLQTIMDLTRALKGDKGQSKDTVITMLNRTEVKGTMRHEEGERTRLFYPITDRTDAALQETREFLERAYEGNVSLMVDAMASSKSLSEQEVEELYEILRKAEEGTP